MIDFFKEMWLPIVLIICSNLFALIFGITEKFSSKENRGVIILKTLLIFSLMAFAFGRSFIMTYVNFSENVVYPLMLILGMTFYMFLYIRSIYYINRVNDSGITNCGGGYAAWEAISAINNIFFSLAFMFLSGALYFLFFIWASWVFFLELARIINKNN